MDFKEFYFISYFFPPGLWLLCRVLPWLIFRSRRCVVNDNGQKGYVAIKCLGILIEWKDFKGQQSFKRALQFSEASAQVLLQTGLNQSSAPLWSGWSEWLLGLQTIVEGPHTLISACIKKTLSIRLKWVFCWTSVQSVGMKQLGFPCQNIASGWSTITNQREMRTLRDGGGPLHTSRTLSSRQAHPQSRKPFPDRYFWHQFSYFINIKSTGSG